MLVALFLLEMFLYNIIVIKNLMIIHRELPAFAIYVLNGILPDTQILELPFENCYHDHIWSVELYAFIGETNDSCLVAAIFLVW